MFSGRIACTHIDATDVTRSVVCVSVCVLGTAVGCAKMAEPIEMPFRGGGADWRGSDVDPSGGRYRTKPFAAASGDKSAMRPFVKLRCTLVFVFTVSLTVTVFRAVCSSAQNG